MFDTIKSVFAIIGGIAAIITIIQSVRVAIFKRKITWDDALRVAEKLLNRIQAGSWKPDVVIGLGRSGGIWGGWLAGNLGSLPFGVIDNKYPRVDGSSVDFPGGRNVLSSVLAPYPEARSILVVEGASSRGETPKKFKLDFAKELEGLDVKFAVLYKNPTSDADIDFTGMIGPEPWPDKFPWHHTNLYRPYLRDIVFD